MMNIFRKSLWKYSMMVGILLIAIGLLGLNNLKGFANNDTLLHKENEITKKLDIKKQAEIKNVASSDSDFLTKPQIVVPVDMEMERNAQQQVDEGHSPWRLDLIQTTITFVSLKIHPEGISGPFPIKEEDLEIIQETEKVAIVQVKGAKTPVVKVYLQRLIRQDSTGIWSVVGYDPIEGLAK